MKLYAARYEWGPDGDDKYEVVLYYSFKQSEEDPHSYPISFSPKDWKKLGCRLPRKNETMAVELTAKELPVEKGKKR